MVTVGTIPGAVRKALRYISIYGLGRTVFKIVGRTGWTFPQLSGKSHKPDIGIIGCGQFGFATIGYFITRRFGARFRSCYDIDDSASRRFSRSLATPRIAECPTDIFGDPGIKLVYIASNHRSHAPYAVEALCAGKDVYVEKPVAVTMGQLAQLHDAVMATGQRIYAGYNRPFSSAVQYIRRRLGSMPVGGLSLQCFVAGHLIPPDHWYRHPEEGTRICGNAGHWIDLFVHILSWRGMPDHFRISLDQADKSEPDDNISLSISTDRGDIFSLLLTSRNEPFEGINETINFQQDDVTCKIDDFRRLTLWKEGKVYRKAFWPKDVGHDIAILQPFRNEFSRDWHEVVCSSILMLRIMEMVQSGRSQMQLNMSDELNILGVLATEI